MSTDSAPGRFRQKTPSAPLSTGQGRGPGPTNGCDNEIEAATDGNHGRTTSDRAPNNSNSKFVFLLTSVVAPVALIVALPGVVHAAPVTRCGGCVLQAPEFDLNSVSTGLAAFVGAAWIFLNRFRRNR